jgi:hypothetical protein
VVVVAVGSWDPDDPEHVPLDNPDAVVRLLYSLRNTGAHEQAAALADRAAARAPLDNPDYVASLVYCLRKAGAREQAAALADRAAADAPVDNPYYVARLLNGLRKAGAREQVAALVARAPAAHAPLDNPAAVASLLDNLRWAGAREQAAALLARDPATHASLDNPAAVASLLESLQYADAREQVAALLARDPAGHVALDNPAAVASLLDRLRKPGADRQFAALADRAVADAPLDNPEYVLRLLNGLRQAGAREQAAALLARDPALHVALDNLDAIVSLLYSLLKVDADGQAAALAERVVATAPLDNPDYLARLVSILYEAGAYEQAAALSERAATRRLSTAMTDDEPRYDAEEAERQAEPGQVRSARPRYLTAQCPESVEVHEPFSLLASIKVAASPMSAQVEPFDVPPEGQDVDLVMYAPGLHVLSDYQQTVHVPANADSRPVRFELRADTPGPAKVSITAWIGGTHLGELRVEVTAERYRAPGRDQEARAGIITQPTAGAVSLVVRYDPTQQAYRFEFRDEDNPGEVHSNLAYDPGPVVEQLIADLDSLADGRSGYSAGQTRDYLVNAGARLWQQLVPGQLREQFWDRQGRIRQLTILADKDAVPWELLYPMDPGHDAGFLVEQFPVTRAIFGWRPGRTLRLQPTRFVLPEGSNPTNPASVEVEAIRRLLDPGQAPNAVISELTPLTRLPQSRKRSRPRRRPCSSTPAAAPDSLRPTTGSMAGPASSLKQERPRSSDPCGRFPRAPPANLPRNSTVA